MQMLLSYWEIKRNWGSFFLLLIFSPLFSSLLFLLLPESILWQRLPTGGLPATAKEGAISQSWMQSMLFLPRPPPFLFPRPWYFLETSTHVCFTNTGPRYRFSLYSLGYFKPCIKRFFYTLLSFAYFAGLFPGRRARIYFCSQLTRRAPEKRDRRDSLISACDHGHKCFFTDYPRIYNAQNKYTF